MSDDLSAQYARVSAAAARAIFPETDFSQRMESIVDAIWDEFGSHRPVSWVGFYLLRPAEMILGPRRDKPACSPIGLHGACGTVALSGTTLVVRDVRELGDAYIACDPRDLSEIVVPVRARGGRIVGVLDLDSHSAGAFGEADRDALEWIVGEHLGSCEYTENPQA